MEDFNQHFMGKNSFVWWFGIVENRIDPLKLGRCQVRIFGWNTENKSMLPTKNLIWAHPVLPLNNDAVIAPKEGSMIFGFFMDGKDAQYPVMLGQLTGIPDKIIEPDKGFSDPRSEEELKSAPKPPEKITYREDGSGANITESNSANRYPNTLNEPTSSRIARNENIEETIIQQKKDNRLTNVPVSTGAMTTNIPVDVGALLRIQAALPSIQIPRIGAGFNFSGGFEICGLGINVNLSAGIEFGGFTISPGILQLDGTFLFGTISMEDLLLLDAIIGGAKFLIDLAGCLLGGFRLGNNFFMDGGLMIPLLPAGITITTGLVTRGTVIGGISLGNVGGIPMSTQPYWEEPITPYNARYPYNNVHQSESGHVIEIDDTPGAERLHRYHRSGTFEEIGPDGSKVTKVVKNNYTIVMSDDDVMVMGDCNITVKGKKTELVQDERNLTVEGKDQSIFMYDKIDTIVGNHKETILKDKTTVISQNKNELVKGTNTLMVEKDINVFVKGSAQIMVKENCMLGVNGDLYAGIKGNANLNVGGDLISNIKGDATIHTEGDTDLTVDGAFTLTASTIDLNAGRISFNNKMSLSSGIFTLEADEIIMTSPQISLN